ncbi:quinoprotein dehydrogenase-associated SoxYZ-like carrier [Donghicola sp. C2-DW-16]|uniref:Quinoprotein dehydrogenase-associated SoxYZ-like carrier n=1 Tax=Donghicola mangrovi TaxID=2729614 RepID=A0ABX2PGH2_9RHOB|nr:quinoprotein dehydrogenase-associated SoxYZ-like carrier [Donghicola mangrovi]NVO28503.1 quinoprotein dehydrogenase-associated SoxYZ-like carrier [Donghicola mangrovi]
MFTRCLITAAVIALGLPAFAQDNPMRDGPTWGELQADVIGEVTPIAATGLFVAETPARAQDAATVPIRIIQSDPAMAVTKAIVVVDENPAPVAGTFSFGPQMLPLDFELRVRVNQYSNVRVLAETPNGLAMDGGYVKASGGCSAPATKDPEMAKVDMGQMKLRTFASLTHNRQEAQIMIRHPNYSGLQRDQLTQLFIPAHFLDKIEVAQGDEVLFTMEGGISISENPAFRFVYTDNGAPALTVTATDTEGNIWRNVLPKTGS